MSRIHSTGTKPELAVRRWLWNHGYRYRLNVRSVPGKPDIVMRRYRTAIFVNGCFWHGHGVLIEDHGMKIENSYCCKIPQSNRDFWVAKIRRNQERDERNYSVLRENGWQVVVVWECELVAKQLERTMREVEVRLNENLLSLYRRKPVPYSLDEDEPLPMAAESNEIVNSE